MEYLATNRETILKNPKYRRLSTDLKALYQVSYNLCDSAGFLPTDISYLCFLANVKNEPTEDEFFDEMKGFVERVSDELSIVVNFVIFAKLGTKDAITPWADIYRCIFTATLERQNQGLNDAYAVLMRYNTGLKIKSLEEGKHFLEPVTTKDGFEKDHKTKKAYERAVFVFSELGIPFEGTTCYEFNKKEDDYTIKSSDNKASNISTELSAADW
jgi:hypothetical protein